MHLQIACNISWLWFCLLLGFALLITIFMSIQGKRFYTDDGVIRQFSIMDLEFAATPKEIVNIISGMYKLPGERSKKAVNAVRMQLIADFVFMPAIYGAIFLLCMQVSCKMLHFGRGIFAVLAWLQLLPWLCDIIENIYLLGKINPSPVESSEKVHTAYLRLEIIKWGLSLTAAVCAIAAIFFFWLSGYYSINSLHYLAISLLEVILFLVGMKIVARKTAV